MRAMLTTRVVAGVMMVGACAAAALAAEPPVLRVWPGAAPGSETWVRKEIEYRTGQGKAMVRNVVQPTLTAYLPEREKATGTAMIVCPGGAFLFHSWDNEGVDVAKWLSARGVAAFVLKYRLRSTPVSQEEFQQRLPELLRPPAAANPDAFRPEPDGRAIAALAAADGRQAVKLVRQRAAEWGIRTDRIGIMGFSAGAAVTMGVVMEHETESRPDFAAPIYGGSTGTAPVPADAPPLFVLCAADDSGPAVGSAKLFSEWKSAAKPVELHIYAKGGHGFGMRKQNLPIDGWIERLGDWLGSLGLLKP